MITYTWKVTELRVTNIDDLQNTVVQTFWEKVGTDENGNTSAYTGATPLSRDFNGTEQFVPFEKLTEETVLEWIKSTITNEYEDRINQEIQKKINEKVNPIVNISFPWT